MDDIKQFLQHNSLQYGSTDSISETGSEESTISAVKIGPKADRQGRMPTRRPNPNVQNRNALLARENRRKKKVHLESLEKELEEVRAANKHLKKMLKQQMKAVGQLQREKRYFQSVIANHKEIENLIKALNVRMHVQQSSNENSPMLNSPGYCPSPNIFQHVVRVDNGLQNSYFDRNLTSTSGLSDNGSVGIEELYHPEDAMQLCNILDNFSSEFAPSSAFNDSTWTDLLDEDFGTKDLAQLTTVAAEHSYADLGQMSPPKSTDADAGICLHIRQGKISLEFCPNCSWNANDNPAVNAMQN